MSRANKATWINVRLTKNAVTTIESAWNVYIRHGHHGIPTDTLLGLALHDKLCILCGLAVAEVEHLNTADVVSGRKPLTTAEASAILAAATGKGTRGHGPRRAARGPKPRAAGKGVS